MAKLGKREMIILGVMAVAVLIAAVDFFMPKKKIPMIDVAQKTEELNTFVSDLTARMGTDSTKGLSAIIFALAEKDWTQDPFLDSKSYKTWGQSKEAAKEGSGATQKIEFVYSGYLEVRGKRMAIINGMEYKEGDPLDVRGYFLKNISATRVVIENRGSKATLNVPLQE